MSMAMQAARGPLQASLGQWLIVGLGALYISDPDKFFKTLQKTSQFLLQPDSAANGQQQQQPIVIMQGGAAASKNPVVAYLIQLTAGVGVAWGGYMVLLHVLPDSVKGMLPVSKMFFSKAVTKLGKGILDVRDSLLEQMLGLSDKQAELSAKQDETHGEILYVKDDVRDMRSDLGMVQETLDLCQESLTEAEQRQAYIARGVRLLTRGVSSILPQEASLAYELDKFNKAGADYNRPSALKERLESQRRAVSERQLEENPQQYTPDQRRLSAPALEVPSHDPQMTGAVTPRRASSAKSPSASDVPVSPLPLEDIRDLLSSIQIAT